MQSTHLAYYLHYPGQLFRGVPLVVEYTPNQGLVQGNLPSKNFWIDSVEIVRSRNTLKNPCMTNSSNSDEYIATNLFEISRCQPPNWKNGKYPQCKDRNSMKKAYVNEIFFDDPVVLANMIMPCKDHAKIYVIFKGATYKEILHIRAFDIESLVGNMGGYIGLFLGFAIWQLPDGIKLIAKMCKKALRNDKV